MDGRPKSRKGTYIIITNHSWNQWLQKLSYWAQTWPATDLGDAFLAINSKIGASVHFHMYGSISDMKTSPIPLPLLPLAILPLRKIKNLKRPRQWPPQATRTRARRRTATTQVSAIPRPPPPRLRALSVLPPGWSENWNCFPQNRWLPFRPSR